RDPAATGAGARWAIATLGAEVTGVAGVAVDPNESSPRSVLEQAAHSASATTVARVLLIVRLPEASLRGGQPNASYDTSRGRGQVARSVPDRASYEASWPAWLLGFPCVARV